MTPEQTQRMIELLPVAPSLRAIANELRVSHRTIATASAPFLAIMRLNGTLPKCACGRPRFHPYGCSAGNRRSERRNRGDFIPGRTTIETAILLAKRKAIIEALVAGGRFCDIDRQFGDNKCARKYLRFLSPEQLAERERNVAGRDAGEQFERLAA